MLSCTNDSDKSPKGNGITVETDQIILTEGGTSQFCFTVTPADIDFNYSTTAADCQVSLEVSESDNQENIGKAPTFYKLSKVEQTSNGLYTATIKDQNKSRGYCEKVILKITGTDKSGKEVDYRSAGFDVIYASTSVESMAFLKVNNETSVYQDITFNTSSKNISIKTPFISSPNLVLSYKIHGCKVTVNGVEQESGVTVNDFSSPVTYKLTYASGKEETYTISVTYSGLPVLFINTPNNATVPDKHSDWLANTDIKLYNPDWTVDLEGKTGIRGRGNSTWSYPKKPYALKLDNKSKVLGMPKHKRWVLLANWMDRTILRNRISFAVAMKTGLAWTPHGEFVELILNGQHKGNYYLCEQIKIDENRVDIDELDETKTDSGFLMELDTYYDEEYKFHSQYYNLPYMFKDPDEVNSAQFSYFQNYVNTLEASLNSSSRFASREYTNYIDVDSFIDWWLVHELTGNEEPKHPKSSYMHKDAGGKLTMGPVWDFDWGTFMPHTKFVCYGRTDGLKPIYYDRLMQDAQFKARVKERWNALEAGFREIPAYIESEAARIKGSESMNHVMWPCNTKDVIGYIVNQDEHMTFEQAVERMKSAYEGKLNWMDTQISNW